MPQPQIHSNLPVNAPVFQPGAAAYPGTNASAADVKHRKAASVGAALSNNFNSFAPHLGSMVEDAEDAGGASFEDGEIADNYYQQPGHQARAQSQSFMAPRFAALAAQQEQGDAVGPTGRPQLAPGFMFGAGAGTRKRGGPMGPPINEEDVNFQFPQQQHFPSDGPTESKHRKSESAEITGIMAEQVHSRRFQLPQTVLILS
jgi:protein SSD1